MYRITGARETHGTQDPTRTDSRPVDHISRGESETISDILRGGDGGLPVH